MSTATGTQAKKWNKKSMLNHQNQLLKRLQEIEQRCKGANEEWWGLIASKLCRGFVRGTNLRTNCIKVYIPFTISSSQKCRALRRKSSWTLMCNKTKNVNYFLTAVSSLLGGPRILIANSYHLSIQCIVIVTSMMSSEPSCSYSKK